MVSPHRYSSHALVLLAMLFVTGCFAAASVMSLAEETSDFPFRARPTELLARLPQLDAVPAADRPALVLPPEVLRLLERSQRGEVLKDRELIDAFLIASGVFDRPQRDQYARRIDEITAAARTATATAETPFKRGDALLQFLHQGAMKGGYDAQQTRLSVLLDTGKFNCVSSAALYQIVAERLNLRVQALSIPSSVLGHAMCMFLDGDQRIDVETTNPDGFSFRSKVKESGATVVGIQLDPAEGHDVSPQGLASLIAQNLAAAKGKDTEKRPFAAIQAALVGLALDPSENAKANNFVAALNDYAMGLGDASKFVHALQVMQLGLDLLPADDTLVNNADVLWSRYAKHEVKAGRGANSVAVIKRATALGQLKRPDEALAAPFISIADDLCDSENWSEAVAVLDLGLQAVDGDAAANLRKWLVQVHNRWAQAQRKRGDYEAAIAALAALCKKTGDIDDARGAIEYFAQESLAELDRSGGPQAAAKLLARLQSEFSTVEYLKQAGSMCARRGVDKLLSAKKFSDAAAAVEHYRPLLADDAARDEVGGHVFDAWGRELVRKKDWQQAVKIYGDGLKQYPSSDLLKSNVVVAWDSWAAQSLKNKEWREAIRIYELALKTLGDNPHLQQNLEFCRSKLK